MLETCGFVVENVHVDSVIAEIRRLSVRVVVLRVCLTLSGSTVQYIFDLSGDIE